MAIQFSNLASTTLASGVSSSATSVSVTSASSFPSLGSGDYFYATIGAGSGSEIVKVTAISGTTFTVVRGEDGTTAVSHASGADCALRVTAGTLEDLRDGGQVYTAGSGLGLSGNEFTNTAPDQTVSLTGAGTTSVSGTYPNFTITGAGTTYTAGSGLSLNGTEFANTAPDQTVALTGAGATSISGTYPNFTITSTDTVYTLPAGYATETYVGTAISNLVDSSPAALNTLNELAAALGDDPNFATTVSTSIGTKLPLAGGTLTGALAGTTATFSSLDVNGIIDNTYNNGNVSAPNNSDHTAGTRIKFYDGSGTSWYAMGMEPDTLWFNSDNNYKFYRQSALKVDFDNAGVVNAVGGYKVNGTTVIDSSRNLRNVGTLTANYGAVWSETVQGQATGTIHLDPDSGTDNTGSAITFGASDASAGANAQAGIYTRSDGAYGTKLYLSTTDNYSSGSKTALSIDHSGNTSITRGALQIGGTTVIDSSRNLTNIGTISSGAITSTGNSTHGGYSSWTGGNGTAGIFMHYNASSSYRGYFDWRTLQLGNDDANNVLFGNTSTGGYGRFYVNSTAINQLGGTSGIHAFSMLATGEVVKEANERFTIKSHSNGWAGGMRMISSNGGTTFQLHPDDNGWMYVDQIWNFNGDIKMGGTTIIDTSRNLTNIGTLNGGTAWTSANDGSGSGLDADTVDGVQAAAIVYGGSGYGSSNAGFASLTNAKAGFYDVSNSGTPTSTWYSLVNMAHYGSNHGHQIAGSFYSAGDIYNRNNNNTSLSAWAKIWNTANDGSGSGLDADLLDGYNTSTSATANTVVVREGSGHIYGNYILGSYFNASSGNNENPTIGQIWTQSTGDNYLRKSTPAHFASQLNSHLVRTDGSNPAFVKVPANYTGNLNSISNAGVYFTEATGSVSNNPFSSSGSFLQFGDAGGVDVRLQFYAKSSLDKIAFRNQWGNGNWGGWREFWTTHNDGSGSGLDADLLDGIHASGFIQSGGSWNASNMPGSRHAGISVNSGEVVFQRDNPGNGQMSVMVDGNFYAGETNGFWSLYSGNNYNAKVGMYSNSSGHLLLSTSSAYAGGNIIWHAGNDGSGSGLDADTVDGQHASAFATTSGNVTGLSITGLGNNNFTYGQTSGSLNGFTGWAGHLISNHGSGATYYMQDIILPFWGSPKISRREGNSNVVGPYDIWTSENDGSGSGLDADTVDGIQGASLLRSDADDSFTGALISTSRHNGIFGIYDSTKTDHIWSMGTSYKNHSAGANFGNLYGLAYKHTNNGTGGSMASGHMMVWCQNGTPYAAMGNNIWTQGNVYAASFLYNSDRAFKTNIKPIKNALSTVLSLSGVSYTLKKSGKNTTGFIAQEVEKVLPDMVDGDEGEKGVNYGQMVALLTEAMREQQNLIVSLQKEIQELKDATK